MKSSENNAGWTIPKQVQLAPCPFCGCKMHVETSRAGHILDGPHAKKCPLHSDRMELTPVNDLWLPQMVEFWNRRFQSINKKR